MMKGKNELVINQATIKQAVQFWLQSEVLKSCPTVTSVTCHDKYSGLFKVELEESPDLLNEDSMIEKNK